MDDLLALSARVIDERITDEPTNRVTNELSELADDLAVVESFSHVVAFRTGDGLVLFDASSRHTGAAVTEALRGWSTDVIDTVVYTHGHVDHVGGSGPLLADGRARGHRPPRVIGHENIHRRFDRYDLTDGWNTGINNRQFGGAWGARAMAGAMTPGRRFLAHDVARCTTTFADRTSFEVGGLRVELRHARGETDDHTWAWIPDRRAICVGDFLTWVFPNAGNPQKVQRYPGEWAAALRDMAAHEPELLLPAHGLPIAGRDRIATVLATVAGVLERLVRDVVDAMNAGLTLDEIVHSVGVDPELLSLPYLKPVYDEPEFVVHNIWRLYGGWWDGDPAQLKPAPKAAVATEVVALAGGTAPLLARAEALAAEGDLRLACHLVELAWQAEPDDETVQAVRRRIYAERRRVESSLMAKGIFAGAAGSSERPRVRLEP